MSDKDLKRIMNAWKTALGHLDATEPQMRELIESHLMEAEPGTKKVGSKKMRVDALMKELESVRTGAVKKAFRHLRDKLPDLPPSLAEGSPEGKVPLRIYGETLTTHAYGILHTDLGRTRQAIENGMTAGLGNTDIAHSVIGSRQLRGLNGQTEQTRQHILRLAKGYLRTRKNRMAGSE